MASVRRIEAPAPSHQCALPWNSGGYGSTGEADGTLVRCWCRRWWFSAPCYQSLGPVTHWRRVRWWHWRLRRRIAES